MKRAYLHFTKEYQNGSVSVEAAVCIGFVLVPLLAFVLLFGRFFWYYTAVQKAVHDATLYMSGAPLTEIRNGSAEGLANDIMGLETADFDSTTTIEPSIACGYRPGGSFYTVYTPCSTTTTPAAVQAVIFVTVRDPFFFSVTGPITGRNEIGLMIFSQMPYVGK